MKRYVFISILVLSLVGCQEEIDFIDQSFTRVYGLDGWSEGGDIIEAKNGDLIMVGEFTRAFYLDNSETNQGGFIIRTDANGNQLNFRNFYFTRAELLERANEYRDFLGLTELSGDVEFYNGGRFKHVVELENENFFVVGTAFGSFDGDIYDQFDYIFILDPDFEPIKFQFFHNSQQEIQTLPGGRFLGSREARPIKLDNGDMLLLVSTLWQDYFTPINGYSIYRITEDGNIVTIWDFNANEDFFLTAWAMDDQDNVVIYGAFFDTSPEAAATQKEKRDADIVLHKIDLTSGTRVKESRFGKGHNNITFKGGIQATGNGFVISDYHTDTVGTKNWDPDNDGFRNLIGGLWFVDNNLDSLYKTHITDDVVNQGQSRLIKTADGGFVVAYFLRVATGDKTLVVRTDETGNVLWQHTLENAVYGRPLTIIETQDGGIVLWGRRDFNSMGQRSTLIKLSADGKL